MSTVAEKNFLEFDWNCKEWQKYLEGLYPTPPLSKIMKYKKRWFKKAIDPSFDVDSTVGEDSSDGKGHGSTAPSTGGGGKSASSSGAAYAGPPPPGGILGSASTAALFAGLFFSLLALIPISIVARSFRFALMSYAVAFGCSVFGRCGMPQWSKHYAQRVVEDESTFMIFYCLLFFSSPPFFVLLAPPALTALLELLPRVAANANQVQAIISRLLPSAAASLQEVLTPVISGRFRYKLMGWRGDLEVAIAFLLLFLALLRRTTLFTVFFYWSFLRMRCMASAFTQHSFRKIDTVIMGVLSKPACPATVKGGYEKARGYLKSFVDPSQQAARPGCSIM